jgi:uncharacterized RDD family membrane protein YckC
MMPNGPERTLEAAPAGFWQRTAAWTLDAALLALPAWWLSDVSIAAVAPTWRQAGEALSLAAEQPLRLILNGRSPVQAAIELLSDSTLAMAAAAVQSALVRTFAAPVGVFVLLAFAWHLGFERSPWRASPGKRALGLYVADRDGRKPPAWRSAWRFLAGTASWLTLNLGHALAALPPRRLALHDRLSGTRVLARRSGLPAWARAWLLLQLLLLLAANVWLLVALDAAVQGALQRVLA